MSKKEIRKAVHAKAADFLTLVRTDFLRTKSEQINYIRFIIRNFRSKFQASSLN